MLNETKVLDYIKDNLGFGFVQIELSDSQILDYVQKYTLNEFSHYVPEVRKLSLNLTLDINKVPNRENEYYLYDPDNREILNVKNIYFTASNYLIFGHPLIGAFNQNDLRNWALDVYVAGMLKSHSSFHYTFNFQHPNILRISPIPRNLDYVLVEYERMQSPDFSGIPNDLHRTFLDLALADIMIVIGRIRKKYSGQTRTPWGEIPLNDEILEEGNSKKRDIIDKLERLSLLNVSISIW